MTRRLIAPKVLVMAQKFLIIKNLLLLLNILALGTIGYFTWEQTKQGLKKTPPKVLVEQFFDKWEEKRGIKQVAQKKEIIKRISIPLEVVVANLAQINEDSHYITFYPVLTFRPGNGTLERAFAAHLPKVRDKLLSVVNSKTKDELLAKNGKMNLKNELKSALNTLNLPYTVDEIFFTGFVVQ